MRLTVLHLIGRFPVLYERSVLEEIAAVGREGLRTRIVAFHPAPDKLPGDLDELAGNVAYLDLARQYGRLACGVLSLAAGVGAAVASPRRFKLFSPKRRAGDGSRAAGFWRRVRLTRMLQGGRVDVLHAQFGHLGFLVLPVARSLGVPLVVSFRGQDVLLAERADGDIRGRLFRDAARILVRCADMQQDLARLGCPAEKIFIQPSGLDVEEIPFRERSYPALDSGVVILMAGRLVPKKGMADALCAVAACRPGPEGPQIRIAGDGPERTPLERLAAELGLAGRVQFLGKIPRDELIREMLSAHLFLLPCRLGPDGEKEGIPNAIKEAMATGLPVLSTRHAGIPECVQHEQSGLLAEEGDVDAVADALKELLSKPERWPGMGRKGRAIIEERYDVRKLVSGLVQHYDRVLCRVP